MMRWLFCLVVLSWCCCIAVADTNVSPVPAWRNLRYERKLISPRRAALLGAITFDNHIYEHTAADFRDLRILSSKQQEVPFIIRPKTAVHYDVGKQSLAAEIISLNKTDNQQRLELVLAVPKRIAVFMGEELRIETDERDFEKRIAIYGGNDLKQWDLLKKDAIVFDYSSIVDLRNQRVSWNPSNHKYYKLVIDNFQELRESPGYSILTSHDRDGEKSREIRHFFTKRDFRIKKVWLYAQKSAVATTKTVEVKYPVATEAIRHGHDRTEIVITLPRCPITVLEITTSSNNFSRRATLVSLGEKDIPINISSGQIRSLRLPGINESSLRLTFPESRATRYRLTVVNHDSPPLADIVVNAYGPTYQAEFLTAKLKRPLTLYYGGSHVAAPLYDIPDIIKHVKNSETAEFTLAEAAMNPAFRVPTPPRQYKWVAWSVIGFATLALLAILAASIRRFNKLDGGEEPL